MRPYYLRILMVVLSSEFLVVGGKFQNSKVSVQANCLFFYCIIVLR
jgi:hypothetical protein